ncbi:MAG: hypothetical protein ACK5LY_10670 [Lachnospirales bacterium]
MNFNEKVSLLTALYNENNLDELFEKLEEFDDAFLSLPFIVLCSKKENNIEEGRQFLRGFNLSDYLKDYYDINLRIINFSAYQVGHKETLELLCNYFYDKTKDSKEFLYLYEFLIIEETSYEKQLEYTNFILDNTDEFTSLIYGVQFFCFKALIINKDSRLYNFALMANEKFQVDSNILMDITSFAFANKNYDFIVDYYKKLSPFFEQIDINFSSFTSKYIQAKDILGIDILEADFKPLLDLNYFIILNIDIFKKYLNKYTFTPHTKELIDVFNGRKLKNYSKTVALYALFVDMNFDKILELLYKNEYNMYDLYITTIMLKTYNSTIATKFYDLFIDFYKTSNEKAYYLFHITYYLGKDNNFEEFEYILKAIDSDNLIYSLHSSMEQYSNDVEDNVLLFYYGTAIKNVCTSTKSKIYANILLLAYNYNVGNKEEFVNIYETLDDKTFTAFSPRDAFTSIFNTNASVNKDIFIYLLEKNKIEFSGIYFNAVGSFLYPQKNIPADLTLVGKVFDIIDAFVSDLGVDALMHDYNCITVMMGIYNYYLGEFEKARETLQTAAYTSSKYCNCGVAALLTYNYYEYSKNADIINAKIVLKSINNYKLIAPNKYVKENFNNNIGIITYYCYFALNQFEDFDLEVARTNLLNKNNIDIEGYYFLIKIYDKLGNDHLVNFYKNKLRLTKDKGFFVYEEKYLEILEDTNCPLYRPEFYPRNLFTISI